MLFFRCSRRRASQKEHLNCRRRVSQKEHLNWPRASQTEHLNLTQGDLLGLVFGNRKLTKTSLSLTSVERANFALELRSLYTHLALRSPCTTGAIPADSRTSARLIYLSMCVCVCVFVCVCVMYICIYIYMCVCVCVCVCVFVA